MEDKKYIASIRTIKDYKVCSSCPSRLYCKNLNDFIKLGLTDINAPNMIIVPSYNTEKEDEWNPIKLLDGIHRQVFGISVLNKYYITRAVKCNTRDEYAVNVSSIPYCFNILQWEIFKINPIKIIVIGCDAIAEHILKIRPDAICISHFMNSKFDSEFVTAIQ